jgi:hypothetical protein
MHEMERYLRVLEANGELLFHYTTPLSAIKHILREGKLMFNSLGLSHDPIEFEDLDYSAHTWASGDRNVVTEQLDQLVKKGRRENDVVKKFFKIACFCRDLDDLPEGVYSKGCNRSMMWSHYGEGHSGVCLVFAKNDLISEVQRQIGTDGLVLGNDVNYTNDLRKLEAVLNLGPADGVASDQDRIQRNAKHLLFTKLLDFRSESEFRICFWKRQQIHERDREFIDIRKAIVAVLLGSAFPEPFDPLVNVQARSMNVPVFQVYWLSRGPLWVDMEHKKALL